MLTLNDGRSELWQWDTGRKLTVDADCTQVHFSNKVFGRSIDVDVAEGIAVVPDILLQTDKDLTAWAFVGTAENGYTKISRVFKVNKRNKPADYVFTPLEQTTLGEIMERLDLIEESQDPDAIKNAIDDYLASNPIQVKETDPTVPDWAKQPTKPEYTVQEVGAVATVNGIAPDENGNVKVDIPEGGATPEQAKQIADNKTAIEKIQESMVCGIGISKIMRITQSEYDALETKDETTLYIISDNASEEEPDDGMIPYLHITAPCDIDTGIIPTENTSVEVTFYDTDLKSANGYIGAWKYYISGQNAPWLGAAISGVTFSVNVNNFTTTGVKNTFRLDNTGLYINGILAQAASQTPTDPGWSTYGTKLRLFICPNTLHYTDVTSPNAWLNDAKFYGAKIWQAGELVRDMIPAEDSSGVACVYDKVTQTYLYKTETNTGTLTYGEEVDE